MYEYQVLDDEKFGWWGNKSHLQATVGLAPLLPWTTSQPMADHSFTTATINPSLLTLGSSGNENQNSASDVTSQTSQGTVSQRWKAEFDFSKTAFIDPSVTLWVIV
jgi:hypothetical protein